MKYQPFIVRDDEFKHIFTIASLNEDEANEILDIQNNLSKYSTKGEAFVFISSHKDDSTIKAEHLLVYNN